MTVSMQVCRYVCMYVCMHESCMHVNVHTGWTSPCMYVCLCVCAYVSIYIYATPPPGLSTLFGWKWPNWPLAGAATDPGLKISPIEGECLVDGFSATLLHPEYTSRFLVETFEIVSRNLIDLYERLPVRTLINPIMNPDRTLTESPQKHFFGRCMDA